MHTNRVAHLALLAVLAPLAGPALASAQASQRISLWPNGAPGSQARRAEPEEAKDYWVKNIHDPSITVHLPPMDKATGAGVVVIPGGGHRLLVYKAEGVEPAEYLNSLGVAAFVLKHRLQREEGSTYTIERDARADAYRAMRTVRSRAAEFGVDPKRLGVMGFSAGGEVVGLTSIPVRWPSRPRFPPRRRPRFSSPPATTRAARFPRSRSCSSIATPASRWRRTSSPKAATASTWGSGPSSRR